ncbi:ABC-2 type transporter [Candidatus Nitrospira nitrosa]|uniref:Transport permease protein n=1 Tax=Candidatus Nitrospira nitrosa TaxID=1742972 RepID=A0A0S4LFQ1_9BACT|nr:ABC transporter permease [Candidatus Nitrospira nitrosa]CUS36428.1 ABC-2 type transporter [Candidatus Nitrospira nitrosa]
MSATLPRDHSVTWEGPLQNTVHIRPSSTWTSLELNELLAYRELLYFLTWRDIKVRYKQTALGLTWAVLKPLSLMLIFTVVFGWLAQVPSDGLPYPVFSLCAILPWQLFAQTLSSTSQSLVSNQNLLTKVYFPRLVIPLAALGVGLMDFMIAAAILACVMAYFQMVPTLLALLLPSFVLLAVMMSLGVGFWFSALNIQYRDVGHALPFLTQLWFFATPIAYPSSLVPESWRTWYGLNPMATVVEGFRWSLLGTGGLSTDMWLTSVAVTVAVFVSGLYYFRRVEEIFADVV